MFELTQRRHAVLEFEIAGRAGCNSSTGGGDAVDLLIAEPNTVRHAQALIESARSLQKIERRAAVVGIELARQIDLQFRFIDVGDERQIMARSQIRQAAHQLERAALWRTRRDRE